MKLEIQVILINNNFPAILSSVPPYDFQTSPSSIQQQLSRCSPINNKSIHESSHQHELHHHLSTHSNQHALPQPSTSSTQTDFLTTCEITFKSLLTSTPSNQICPILFYFCFEFQPFQVFQSLYSSSSRICTRF